jgi:hypothetical protein
MSQEIRNADGLLNAVRKQCGEARGRARGGDNSATGYLRSANANVNLLEGSVNRYGNRDNPDPETLEALRGRLGQAKNLYGKASKEVSIKLGVEVE